MLVVSSIEERRRHGEPLDEAIIQGSHSRLRAVLMTAALAALGLIPAALSRAIGAETQRPIAVVIVGGTLSAALLTLIVLPVMYRILLRVLEARGTMAPPLTPVAPPASHRKLRHRLERSIATDPVGRDRPSGSKLGAKIRSPPTSIIGTRHVAAPDLPNPASQASADPAPPHCAAASLPSAAPPSLRH